MYTFISSHHHQVSPNAHNRQAHSQPGHIHQSSMYAMFLDGTLYACGTGHHQGCHLKIQLYHNHRHLNTKYSGHRRWIEIF